MNQCDFKGIINRELDGSALGRELQGCKCRLTESNQDGPSPSWTYASTNEAGASVVERPPLSRISEAMHG
jgi:hypothetical protein